MPSRIHICNGVPRSAKWTHRIEDRIGHRHRRPVLVLVLALVVALALVLALALILIPALALVLTLGPVLALVLVLVLVLLLLLLVLVPVLVLVLALVLVLVLALALALALVLVPHNNLYLGTSTSLGKAFRCSHSAFHNAAVEVTTDLYIDCMRAPHQFSNNQVHPGRLEEDTLR